MQHLKWTESVLFQILMLRIPRQMDSQIHLAFLSLFLTSLKHCDGQYIFVGLILMLWYREMLSTKYSNPLWHYPATWNKMCNHLNQWWLDNQRICASLSLNDLNTQTFTVKTNALKKRVVVLIEKILFFISWFSKLVTYILIPVARSIYENC